MSCVGWAGVGAAWDALLVMALDGELASGICSCIVAVLLWLRSSCSAAGATSGAVLATGLLAGMLDSDNE